MSLGTLFLSNLAEVIVVVDCSYLALFSSLDQTHCALVVFGSKCVTIFFYRNIFEYPLTWCTCSAILLLHGWCM